MEGSPIAEKLLQECGVEKEIRERICFLIAHHHEYDQRDGLDYQILVEADFLVNFFEEHTSRDQIVRVRGTIFQTETGKRFVTDLFLREPPRPSLFAQSLKNQA